ncbi:DUF2383 domain-containing protein [Ulvibacter antarcticus]|uniref:Uncharacterized protein DUF2383 n=1 Tax=Ulvibacter antarcticus TaxID=442714 RepID=A0A3L9YB25_9FLAO|nr:DUF2383 domain-containing protein [Ulvibacter antarcticus]RMA57936.1 uncharacterized protein DUF2383 [Ulvibacter antarcticus]
MEKNYKEFNKLNLLLLSFFDCEKIYYNAAQDAQVTSVKRFLNHMATERNRMSFDISNELSSRKIKPLKDFSDSGVSNRSWKEIKEALVNHNETELLLSCISKDEENVKAMTELIDTNKLPDSVLEMLYENRKKLHWYIKQAREHLIEHFEKSSKKEEIYEEKLLKSEKDKGKVINIKRAF